MQAIEEVEDGVLVDILVSTGASSFSINSYNQWRKRIKITVRSPPKKGKANQEIIQEFTSLTQHEVKIVSGIKSREKTIKIYGMTKNDLSQIINNL